MRTRTAFVAVALLVAAVAAVPVAGLAATGGQLAADQHNSTNGNASVAPGERLSGVVGIQQAELEGEVDERTFGIRVAQAATDESEADAVAEQLGDVQRRLQNLERRKQALEQARANGSLSEGKYRAEMAELAARTQTATELADESANATRGLPADLLESKGINATAIETLKERASQLGGPEVAEIARSIAGNAAPVDTGPPGERGQGDGDAGDDAGTPTDTPDDSQQDGTPDATPTPADGGDGSDGTDRASGAGDGGDGRDGANGDGDGGAY
jgi:hypothetical protein